MARRKTRRGATDALDAYRKIRKPVPPPDRVIPDKRRKTEDVLARREADEDTAANGT